VVNRCAFGEGVEIEEKWRARIAVTMAIVILIIWIVAMTRDVTESDYDAPDGLTPLMIIVAGWCFASPAVRKVKEFLNDEETSK